MHPDVHLVRTRPPILDMPPLVWIERLTGPFEVTTGIPPARAAFSCRPFLGGWDSPAGRAIIFDQNRN